MRFSKSLNKAPKTETLKHLAAASPLVGLLPSGFPRPPWKNIRLAILKQITSLASPFPTKIEALSENPHTEILVNFLSAKMGDIKIVQTFCIGFFWVVVIPVKHSLKDICRGKTTTNCQLFFVPEGIDSKMFAARWM